jgi:ubiquinone/menaquinone biosynthesis C-methylase UbiE
MNLIPVDSLEVTFNPNYSLREAQSVPSEAASLALGCGNPTGMAAIQPGETVLDIGSGAGMDAFLAARQVGPQGRVIGVDMTLEMLERARKAAARAGLEQVEFRQGQAEALPVEDNSVDVIITNCVINLTEDKGLVFREAYRVLKPGGRLEVSDMVTNTSIPAELRSDPNNWSGCVFGALPEQEYLDLVAQAGFREIRTQQSQSYGEDASVKVYSLAVSARK